MFQLATLHLLLHTLKALGNDCYHAPFCQDAQLNNLLTEVRILYFRQEEIQ